ncbi:MAG: competence protein ComEA [Desulfuromonas sp.]|nr:MAG: competence protein ComEA [Desulfuromonas sp.]
MKQLFFVVMLSVCLSVQLVAPFNVVAAEKSMKVAALTAPIDINSATAEDFQQVKGIGKVTAERIVQYRDEHGPFSKVEDLTWVKGIGSKTLAKIQDQLTVQ